MIWAVFLMWLSPLSAGHAGAEAGPVPGSVLRDCEPCPELVVVPAGSFVMGKGGRRPAELPAHVVTIPRPFAIGRFEVTFEEWSACVDAGGCTHGPDDHGWGRGRRPVINVNRTEVEAYLGWLREKTGLPYRLPTEVEWDYANRAGSATVYWWSDTAGSNRANCRDCESPWSGVATAPVGSFPPNAFGLYDTTGNVLEWVADCWQPTLASSASTGGAPGSLGLTPCSRRREPLSCPYGTVRGGAWYYVMKTARSAWRSRSDVRLGSYTIGFRVARDLISQVDLMPQLDLMPQMDCGNSPSGRR